MVEQLAFETVDEQQNEVDEVGAQTRRAMVSWAYKRERRIAEQGLTRQRTGTAEEEAVLSADWRTSFVDARTALTIAGGAAPGDINPATGWLHDARAYESLRRGWQRRYDRATSGLSSADPEELIEGAEEARREFLVLRPDLDDGKPWITPPPLLRCCPR